LLGWQLCTTEVIAAPIGGLFGEGEQAEGEQAEGAQAEGEQAEGAQAEGAQAARLQRARSAKSMEPAASSDNETLERPKPRFAGAPPALLRLRLCVKRLFLCCSSLTYATLSAITDSGGPLK
jgi:hypothetical protein